jgi:pimeloyl-ACP methyl ester carboxylesterase
VPYADAAGARIYYETHGEGEPLLIHPGFGSQGTLFRKSTPVLAQRFRTIVLDPRGAGRSDSPPGDYSMEHFADDAAAVLDAAGAESAHVFGTSLGGMVAQRFALRHPRRLRRLILACTTVGGSRHVMPTPETLVTFLAAGDIEDPAAAARSTFPMHYSEEYIARCGHELEAWARENEHLRSTAAARASQSAAAAGHDTYDVLPQIAAPTLVLHGEDDPLIRIENGRMLAERIPGARLIVYRGARHIFFVERADAMNADIAAFLCAGVEAVA